jgi:CHAT domain-containing protein/Flp pilus assembly protein TadD
MIGILVLEGNDKDTTYAKYVNLLGLAYEMRGNYEGALEQYHLAATTLENTIGVAYYRYSEVLNNLAAYYWMVEDYDTADSMYQVALKNCRKSIGTENVTYNSIQNDLALLYHTIGRYEEAEALYLANIAYERKVGLDQGYEYGFSLSNLGSLYWQIGRYEEAKTLFIQAKSIWNKTLKKTNPYYITICNNLANCYSKIGEDEAALEIYNELIEVESIIDVSDPQNLVHFVNMANIYKRLGDYKKAEELYLRARKAYRASGQKLVSKEFLIENNLAQLYLKINASKKAKECFDRILGSLRNEKLDNAYHIMLLHNIANWYKETNSVDTAVAYNLASLVYNSTNQNLSIRALFPEKPSDFVLTDTLLQLAQSFPIAVIEELSELDCRDLELANMVLTQILLINQDKYRLALKYNKYEIAKEILLRSHILVDESIQFNKKYLADFSKKKEKLSLIRQNSRISVFGLRTAFLLQEPIYIEKAFELAETNKSILLNEIFQGRKAIELGYLPDSIQTIEQAIAEEKRIIWEQKKKTDIDKAEIIAKENILNLKVEVFKQRLERDYPQYYETKYGNPTIVASSIQKKLPPKTALLEYFVSDTTTFLFVVTPDTVVLKSMFITEKELNQQIEHLRKSLTDYKQLIAEPDRVYKDYTRNAYWFYENLIAPASLSETIENLIIITDGNLGHLPFESFLRELPQKIIPYNKLKYLVMDYTINYNYSATLWNENLNKKNLVNNHKLLAYAASYDSLNGSIVDDRSLYEIETRKRLQPLPAAREEVMTLAESFQGEFRIGLEATEASFKQKIKEYGVIHLAMHGILQQREPLLSSLVFSEDGNSSENNFLQAYEIGQLDIAADLVVLSACETGYGKFEQGEGVLSLARSFMYAGTPSLVVSLWQVNDKSTAILMMSFYKHLASGMDKAAALRQAKLDYIAGASGIAGHPAFWSPFIQLGDIRPIQIDAKTSYLYYLLLGSLVVGIVGIGFWKRGRRA